MSVVFLILAVWVGSEAEDQYVARHFEHAAYLSVFSVVALVGCIVIANRRGGTF